MSKKKNPKDLMNEDIKEVGADLKKDTKEVMEKVTETNETIKEDIAKAVKTAEETDVKDVAKKVSKKAKKAEETVEKKVEKAVDKTDAAVKKADEAVKKAVDETVEKTDKAVKKAARKAAAKVAPKEKVYLQYLGKDMDVEDIVKAARKDWCDKSGEGEENINSINLYLKPEDDAAYYVVNGSDSGMVKI